MPEYYQTRALVKKTKDAKFGEGTIKRGVTGPDQIEVDIKFCGICHTDVHLANDEISMLLPAVYPIVPGHEMAGIVTKVGENVKNFKVGDRVGMGCIVEACLKCSQCKFGDEQLCQTGYTHTYSAPIQYGQLATDTGVTFGGYSEKISIHEHFAVKIPDSYPMEAAGPIFCSGITMFSPLKRCGATAGGQRVGIIGIGGLGQMGIRLAKAMNCEVTAISTSPNKEAKAREIGADHFVVSTDPDAMKKAAKSLDIILDTAAVDHQAIDYFPLLDANGQLVLIGVTIEPHSIPAGALMFNRQSLSGSLIGSMLETQEVIDFCAKHQIIPDTKLVTGDQVEDVYQALRSKNDSIIRYVLDIEKTFK
ncbi:hypothetical protein TCAL_08838 [Tigriopus californicus]|uniref:Enoyl reductase (ER) domain-containing protein n=1 Tax=Tigriopus californicus TaxID=6832 RepID=A0A553PQ82_TIGCA|nr:uncharacterized protein LOC131882096 [Tigriopus californicus]TRY79848.1 hypothetical protein TCAL_08838 [Tigriopus californicus]|eukprot:TCALIF_08838-PA protein Name:"Similar to adhA Probable formaldehyde dehydrogenase AdhA (Bacillus subtilis (strain 168))" AED:0.06 eAED:0.06 QI:10/1/1/1/1/1/3/21/362